MIIKSTHSQLTYITDLLAHLLDENKPQDLADKLVYGIVFKAFQKIRNKAEFPSRSGYRFTLTDQEALAMFVFLNQVDLKRDQYPYEANQLQLISDQIHQQFV